MKSYHSCLQEREDALLPFPVHVANNSNLLKAVPGGRSDDRSVPVANDEHFRQLLLMTTDAFFEYDIKAEQVYHDARLNALMGTAGKIANLQSWYNFIHPQYRVPVQSTIEQALQEQKTTWEQEYPIECNNTAYKTLKETGLIIYENDKATRLVICLNDVSDLKALQSELARERSGQKKKIAAAILKGQERERNLIGNELHDNINQLLACSKLFLDLVKTRDDDSSNLKVMVSQYLETAVKEIRNLSHGLVTTNFSGGSGLTGSFQKILDDLARAGTFEIAFTPDPAIETIDNSKKLTLFRIFQEQLKNIIKHSKATKIGVELIITNNNALLSINDNGIGFRQDARRRGIGLANIYNRAKLSNGRAELISSPGKGCQLNVSLPVKEPNDPVK